MTGDGFRAFRRSGIQVKSEDEDEIEDEDDEGPS